jgi:DNA-binding HxlR family transcriptional regulator
MMGKNIDLSKIECPVDYALTLLSGKWKIYIIWHIAKNEVIRFNELKRQIDGISDIMLSQTLQEMQKEGIVKRKQYDVVPPKVEYSLTDFGKAIIPIFYVLSDWATLGGWSNPEFSEKIKDVHINLNESPIEMVEE